MSNLRGQNRRAVKAKDSLPLAAARVSAQAPLDALPVSPVLTVFYLQAILWGPFTVGGQCIEVVTERSLEMK